MSYSTYWSELLFKLVYIPFLILLSLLVASQIVSLHRYLTTDAVTLQQLALRQDDYTDKSFDVTDNIAFIVPHRSHTL